MAFPLGREESTRIWVSIYKPLKGFDIEDVVAQLTALTAQPAQAGNASIAILKSIIAKWVAILVEWRSGEPNPDDHPSIIQLSWAKELPINVRVVESGWFRLSCQEHRDISFTKLSVGDVVSVRRICDYDCEKHEVLAYCCLAVLKAYFAHIQGILSYTFYESTDGNQIIGLGIWDSTECASALLNKCKGSPAEAYWRDLGAEKLKYDVCQVIHVCSTRGMDQDNTSFTNCLERRESREIHR